jgi:hypothetical protein
MVSIIYTRKIAEMSIKQVTSKKRKWYSRFTHVTLVCDSHACAGYRGCFAEPNRQALST